MTSRAARVICRPVAPTIAELKSLAAALPPSERVAAGEVADVLSGLAAFAAHGEEILAAAERGSADVYTFFHDHLSAQAEQAGNPAPERGQVPSETTTTDAPVATGAAPAIDYDKLAAAMVSAQAAHDAGAADPTRDAPPGNTPAPASGSPVGEGNAASSDAPAGAPAQGAGTTESGGAI